MKTTILISMLILLNASCKNDDNSPVNPVDSLPPATQIGAQTFGCLIDGKPFIPSRFGQNVFNTFLQNIDGEYFFSMNAPSPDTSISIGADRVENLQKMEYKLVSPKSGSFSGGLRIGLITVPETYLGVSTDDSRPGILTITKHDTQNFILSGTFEFTVLDNDGKEIKITDGRFDVRYTN